MSALHRNESGQAVVEFGIIATVLFLMSIGLLDVGRAFYQYNAISAAARYGARWGGVVGGTCVSPGAQSEHVGSGASVSDWCTQLANPNHTATYGIDPAGETDFWSLNGNRQLQPAGTPCPSDLSGPSSYYYTVSDFTSSTDTSIVGAVAHRFDTSQSLSSLILGAATPGFDLSKLKVCIQETAVQGQGGLQIDHGRGEPISVSVYYKFTPVGPFFGNVTLPLFASAQYTLE